MAFKNRIGGHTNSYHTHTLDDALHGIAAAGFKYVELSAVQGWTEHVPLGADGKTLGEIQRKLHHYGLIPISLSGHSDLTTKEGVVVGKQAIDLCELMGIDIMNTAIGGHYSENEDEEAFMGNIGELADYAAERDIKLGIEIHGEITNSGKNAIPVIEKIGKDNVLINYDTANAQFYAGVKAVDDIGFALPHMVHFHLKDHIGGEREWNFPAVGEGQIDFKKIGEIMTEHHWHGPISIEIEFTGDPFPPVEEVHRSMKASYDHLVSLGWI